MVSITRERFNAAVDKALEIAVYHGKNSLQGEHPRFFENIGITPKEKSIISAAYRDVMEAKDGVSPGEALPERKKKYERLLLDYLAATTELPNRQAFETGQSDVLELPGIQEQTGRSTEVFFCGPFGMGDYDFYKQLAEVTSRVFSSERPALQPVYTALSQGAAVSSTELAQRVLRAGLSAAERDTVARLSGPIVSTYFRADQSAIANAVPILFEGLKVNRVTTERFVDPRAWDRTKIAARLKGDGQSDAIVVATLPADAEVLEKVASKKLLPSAQVKDSAAKFAENLPTLLAAATHKLVYHYDGNESKLQPEWRARTTPPDSGTIFR